MHLPISTGVGSILERLMLISNSHRQQKGLLDRDANIELCRQLMPYVGLGTHTGDVTVANNQSVLNFALTLKLEWKPWDH